MQVRSSVAATNCALSSASVAKDMNAIASSRSPGRLLST